jgi:23S rRNA (cytidine1920-2'-O)/16S rRNA (cytidine1409-2'-O)-methyltransferase
MKKVPVWELLIKRGFFDNKKTAESWIMAGKVLTKNDRITTSGQLVLPTEEIIVKGINEKYVSKGGLKLEGAIKDFSMSINGRVAIDAGASTGGFTDCLLQHGASKIYAVDVGFGQLTGKLRADPRVISMEKVNIGDVKSYALVPQPTLATVDLSYLSLKKSIPIFADILENKGEMICLVKPLFEINDSNIRRTGEIDNPNIYKQLLKELADYINEIRLKVAGITHSHVTGNKGTREFFIKISLDAGCDEAYSIEKQEKDIEIAVENVMKLELFKK